LKQKIQNLSSVTEFIDKYGDDSSSWGGEKIQKRATELALRAYREIWKIK
jgi:hypothetical protein